MKTTTLSYIGHNANNDRNENDFYETPLDAIEDLIKHEKFNGNIWECSCGNGAISKPLIDYGYKVYSSDLIDRGYGEQLDFLKSDLVADNIITNPPYKISLDFVLKAKTQCRSKIAMFFKNCLA